LQSEERTRELGEREKMIDELRRLIDVSREEKQECEQRLAAEKRDTDSLRLQLQQRDDEIERAHDLVRLMLMLLIVISVSSSAVTVSTLSR